MQNFIYKFKDKEGVVVEKKIKAGNINQARSFLKKKKLDVLTVKPETGFLGKLFEERTVQPDDIVVFSQLFAGCIRTGLTIKDSLSLLGKQVDNRLLQDRIAEVVVDIESGNTLSDAFAKHTDIFPVFYPMLLKAGETSGDLAGILDYIGDYLEKITNLKKEIVSVLTYPIVVSLVGVALLSVILIFVAPTFRSVFGASGKALPIPTVILFFLSDLVINNSYLIILTFVGIVTGFFLLNRSVIGKQQLHRFYLVAPLFGPLVKQVLLLRFLRAFDILVNNEVPILQALQVLEEGSTNLTIRAIVKEMRHDVSKGLPISGPLLSNKAIISPLVSYSISMGEQSGNLGEALSRISKFLDREVTFTMKKLTSRLDPLLTFGLGMAVLFVAMAIYLPIFDMMSHMPT
ncbi:MAG: type IV pilus assembly protein PilC [Candidatus Marinamargulisbacteria bacterium]|jgi:type IV pilus assembly protein PilC